MLDATRLEAILGRIPTLTIAVVGDLFLDRYLDIDAALTEPSLETGLDAYQVVQVRPSPGAAGTVINNLVALGVKEVMPVAIIGEDGEGYELRAALRGLGCVNVEGVLSWPGRRTPTYTKPMLHEADRSPRELNRLDIKNRVALPSAAEDRVIAQVQALWPRADAVVILDQVSEAGCGVITRRVREELSRLGQPDPDKPVLADSRERIGLFRRVWLKPNRREAVRIAGGDENHAEDVRRAVSELARRAERPIFCTCGADGILVVDPCPLSPVEV